MNRMIEYKELADRVDRQTMAALKMKSRSLKKLRKKGCDLNTRLR